MKDIHGHPLILIPAILLASSLPSAGVVSFNHDVRPILSGKCFACHGPDEQARKAKLRLDVRESAIEVLQPGQPESSELIERITHSDPDEVMPPPETHKSVTATEAQTLRQWITEGAIYEPHWAFTTPGDRIPPGATSPRATGGIDRFVLARLHADGLDFSPPADPATLVRRLSLDLTGLPPTPEEMNAFTRDPSAQAYDELVDRLLASPRYGEHMAAAWLEAARYADTDGYQNDRYRYQWAWRDWVIWAFNRNLPYDEFVVHQLAGDLVPGATLRQQVATGFCRNHRINSEAGSIPEEWQAEYVADRVDTLGTVFLGITLGCARCHDHKFDPVSQTEYYRLFAYFNNVPEFGTGPNNGNSPPFIPVPEGWPDVPDLAGAVIPDPIAWQKDGKYSGGVRRPVPGDDHTVMVMHEMPEPRTTYRLERGLYNQPDKSEPLVPGVPAALGVDGDFPQNRLGLARWLVHPDHPLTARVAVNRYWQQFFGSGLVRTSENLGLKGESPSHPALLDWLSREFVRSGWDVKAMHKKIVMTATYRQASAASPELLAVDPGNRLLARAPRLRLPAFVIRDQALRASGLFFEKQYGAPAKPYMPPKIWSSISNNNYQRDSGANLYRRSLYTYWRRTIPPPAMMTLNAGDREVCTVRQSRTNTPLQALTLMNNTAFVEASRLLGERIIREGEGDRWLERGFQIVLGRNPTLAEQEEFHADFRIYLQHYQNEPDQAKSLLEIGQRRHTSPCDPARLASMALIASTILNLDEALTRE